MIANCRWVVQLRNPVRAAICNWDILASYLDARLPSDATDQFANDLTV
jgi:hypothetical protein